MSSFCASAVLEQCIDPMKRTCFVLHYVEPNRKRFAGMTSSSGRPCLPVPAIGVLYNALMTEMSLRIGGFATLLQVFDMPTSLSFYRNVLGLDVVSEVPDGGRCDWVMLKRFESELMLNTAYEANTRPPAPEPMRILMQAG